jgi:hypothetical protein
MRTLFVEAALLFDSNMTWMIRKPRNLQVFPVSFYRFFKKKKKNIGTGHILCYFTSKVYLPDLCIGKISKTGLKLMR